MTSAGEPEDIETGPLARQAGSTAHRADDEFEDAIKDALKAMPKA